MATTSSTSCTGVFNFRSNSDDVRVRNSSSHGCGRKLDGVAMWFINGLASAFFGSLERCSCIRIATEDDDGDEANDAPLILNDGNINRHINQFNGVRRRTVAEKCKNQSAASHEY
ncbi:uncharacterized protein LOC126686811 [Mercurialis annua]|uniref:uncharacterized protein LOC126686811 n=1 Tax=Mercurialis annua TaxID=3986 RepID=UPI00215EC7FE|nr:uncharacterized protein LOC126686811 [Mercurialis annua]